MVSAVFWTAHVLLIDRLMQGPARLKAEYKNTDPIELSAGQFAVCAFLCLICAPLIEPHIGDFFASIDPCMVESGLFSWKPFPELVSSIRSGAVSFAAGALIPILYGGIGSVGIAYTLQVVAQSDAPPAHAAIILCFEGFFAALGGVLLLSEKVNGAVLLGFILMLAGMLVTQWEVIGGRKKKGN
jgi:drug/metabolite transporter (DMT)-like permease